MRKPFFFGQRTTTNVGLIVVCVVMVFALAGCSPKNQSPKYQRVQECCAIQGWKDPITHTVELDLKGKTLVWRETQVDGNGQTNVFDKPYTCEVRDQDNFTCQLDGITIFARDFRLIMKNGELTQIQAGLIYKFTKI